MKNSKKLDKKGVKTLVKNRGFFCSLTIDAEKNAPAEFENKVPEGASYFEGIASNGEINRNGYIIRESAWKSAIDEFFTNPVVLLQHNLDEPIGQGLWAKVTKNGLAVGGYLFDELTIGRFGKGLLKALSTGHITKAVEFENEKTGEVITEEQYRARRDKGEIGWGDTNWILAVTKLEWVEFSLVSIGSNRGSFITKRDAIETYLKNGAITENGIAEILAKNEDEGKKEDEEEEEGEEEKPDEEGEEKEGEEKKEGESSKEDEENEDKKEGEEEKPADEPKKEGEEEKKEGENKIKITKEAKAKLDACAAKARETLAKLEEAQEKTEVEKTPEDKPEGEKPEGEEKPAEEKSEGEAEKKPDEAGEKPAEDGKEAKPEDAGEDGGAEKKENKLQIPVEVKTAIQSIVDINTALTAENSALKVKVEKFEAAPAKKGLIYSSQFGGAERSDVEKKPAAEKKSDGGKSAIDFLKANGIEVMTPAK